MSELEAIAYVLDAIEEWNRVCSPEQAAEYTARIRGCSEEWRSAGLSMPSWAHLKTLRKYQAELLRASRAPFRNAAVRGDAIMPFAAHGPSRSRRQSR